MSKISTIYDQLLVILAALYPNKTRLINPYALENNPETFLEDGYGLKVGASGTVDSEFCVFSSDREFTIVLTKDVRFIGDATPMDTVVKALLEDVYAGQVRFINPDQIAIESDIEKIDLGPISEVTYFEDDFNFIAVEYVISIQVTENI